MTITEQPRFRGLDQQQVGAEPLRQLNLLSISDEQISLSPRQHLHHQERDPIARLLSPENVKRVADTILPEFGLTDRQSEAIASGAKQLLSHLRDASSRQHGAHARALGDGNGTSDYVHGKRETTPLLALGTGGRDTGPGITIGRSVGVPGERSTTNPTFGGTVGGELQPVVQIKTGDQPQGAPAVKPEEVKDTSDKKVETKEPAKPAFDLSTAKEVALDKDGKVIKEDGKPKLMDIPPNGLSEGKHMIQLQDGRQFMITLPPGFKDGKFYKDGKEAPLPVMFVMHGSMLGGDDPTKFANETNFLDKDKQKDYAVVQPLAVLHTNGDKTMPAYTWVAPDGGALMSKATAEKAKDASGKKVDDYAYMDSVTSAVDQLIKSNPKDEHKHDNWGAFAFSQGGPFLLKYMSNRANMFPSVALEATALSEDPSKYKPKEGNLTNVVLVSPLNDKLVMNGGFLSKIAGDKIGLDEMGQVKPPTVLEEFLKGSEKPKTVERYKVDQSLPPDKKVIKLDQAVENQDKKKDAADIEVSTYTLDKKSVTVLKLFQAQHCVAGEGPGGGPLGAKYKDGNFTNNKIISQWLSKLGTPKRDVTDK